MGGFYARTPGRFNGCESVDRLSPAVFQDLDATLTALLADPAAPSELRAAETSFVTPVKDFNPTTATLNLFLHGLRENRELRSSVPVVAAVDNRHGSCAPLRIDCTYLITAWSPKTGDLKIADEHQLLGAAVLWLSRNPATGRQARGQPQ